MLTWLIALSVLIVAAGIEGTTGNTVSSIATTTTTTTTTTSTTTTTTATVAAAAAAATPPPPSPPLPPPPPPPPLVVRQTKSQSAYIKLCESIISHAQAAAQAHNAGRIADAMTELEQGDKAYAQAAAMYPNDAQAHANMATSCLNSQRWAKAVYYFELALECLHKASSAAAGNSGDGGGGGRAAQAAAYFSDRLKFARLRDLGTRRNAVYRDGQGDILEALSLATQERALMETPEVLADQAVMNTMLAETDTARFTKAAKLYARAQDTGFKGWAAYQHAIRGEKTCRTYWISTKDASSSETGAVPITGVVRDWHAVSQNLSHVIDSGGDGGSGGGGGGGEFVYLEMVHSGFDTYGVADYTDQTTVVVASAAGATRRRFSLEYQHGDTYLVHILGTSSICGADGVITQANLCRVYTGATGAYVDLAANLQMMAAWDMRGPQGQYQYHDHFNRQSRRQPPPPLPPPIRIARAASIIQFAVTSYYHWVAEALGRLLMLSDTLKRDPHLKLILPGHARGAFGGEGSSATSSGRIGEKNKIRNKNNNDGNLSKSKKKGPEPKKHFIAQFLALLPFPIDPARIVWYDARGPNAERVVITKELLYPDWDGVTNTAASNLPVHCLAPRPILRLIRSSFDHVRHAAPMCSSSSDDSNDGNGNGSNSSSSSSSSSSGGASGGDANKLRRPILVLASRANDKMRRLVNEPELLEALKTYSGYDVHVFDGSRATVHDAIRLFSSASAVVGVHGGALSNVVFCHEGTRVIELGFRSPASRHYAHAAYALNLEYHLMFVERSEQGMAASEVKIGAETIEAVVAAVSKPGGPAAKCGSGGDDKGTRPMHQDL